MYDALLDHDLDEDSPAADIELGGKSIDDESDDDEDLSINNLSDDKAEEPASLDIESDLPDSESWSDDPVRMYLTQMGEIPLLTRQQEINLARRIETSRAGLDNPNKPIGVFMLCGPSGVGKTETALALAEQLYGGEQNVITINMSEFQEAHTVSTLKGAPPGYVGYGEGGVLTEPVRRRPYSVVLLDEA